MLRSHVIYVELGNINSNAFQKAIDRGEQNPVQKYILLIWKDIIEHNFG